jgi:golgin subfamily A member 2
LIQSHIQTIGILVAEKTELQAALTHADSVAKKKAAEADGYAAKLSNLHEKLTHHERSLNQSSLNGSVTFQFFCSRVARYQPINLTNF